jgi:hypothetical protein
MANYFQTFPKTFYTSTTENTEGDVVTNILTRFSFERELKENSATYYKYDIKDGDTPEGLAYKLYDSPNRHWIILGFNDILDPQYDWPLDERTFYRFVESKYVANANTGQSGLTWSQANVYAYYRVEKRTITLTQKSVEDKILVDAAAYANISLGTTTITLKGGETMTVVTTKETKTYYDYEQELNDAKRTIKILKPEFVNRVETELKRVLL